MKEFNVEVGKVVIVVVKRSGKFFKGKVVSYERRGRGDSKYVNIEQEDGSLVTYPVTAVEAKLFD